MGTWGAESFANDYAMDWVAELEGADDLAVVGAALREVTEGDGYVEADVGSVAVAAAEVVAALRGRPAPDLAEEVAAWLARRRRDEADAALVALARRAVDVVADDTARSELRQLWDEAGPDTLEEWRGHIADLRTRLT